MKKNSVLPVRDRLGDGSYLSWIYPDPKARRNDDRGIDVRVVEHQVGDGPQDYRLITSILDPELAIAEALAAAYRNRWGIEPMFDELKSHQGSPGLVLRSKSPDLVRQEIWAYLCVHLAIRRLMSDIARPAGLDPGAISFTATLHSARRSAATCLPELSPQSPS